MSDGLLHSGKQNEKYRSEAIARTQRSAKKYTKVTEHYKGIVILRAFDLSCFRDPCLFESRKREKSTTRNFIKKQSRGASRRRHDAFSCGQDRKGLLPRRLSTAPKRICLHGDSGCAWRAHCIAYNRTRLARHGGFPVHITTGRCRHGLLAVASWE